MFTCINGCKACVRSAIVAADDADLGHPACHSVCLALWWVKFYDKSVLRRLRFSSAIIPPGCMCVCVFFGIIITIFCFAATAVEWWTTDANQLSWSSADGTPANAHWAFACNLDNNNFNILMKCLWCNFKVKCCCRRNGTWSCMRMYKCIYSRRICS